jgi:hypothetical protein
MHSWAKIEPQRFQGWHGFLWSRSITQHMIGNTNIWMGFDHVWCTEHWRFRARHEEQTGTQFSTAYLYLSYQSYLSIAQQTLRLVEAIRKGLISSCRPAVGNGGVFHSCPHFSVDQSRSSGFVECKNPIGCVSESVALSCLILLLG